MVKLKKIFKRKENKYLLNNDSYEMLRDRIAPYMAQDEFGQHTILSVYYDTANYQMIQTSMDKPMYKEKFRLRSYGIPEKQDTVFMEIKKKVQGVVYKRRIEMPYEEARNYHLSLNKQDTSLLNEEQIKREIDWIFSRREITPKVMIAYDRIALQTKDETSSDFRITFDFNIRFRSDDLAISHGSDGQLVAPEIDVLMEVKAMGAYPIWFSEVLSDLNIFKCSFSKYAQTYTRYLRAS